MKEEIRIFYSLFRNLFAVAPKSEILPGGLVGCPAKSDTYPATQGTCPAKSDTYPKGAEQGTNTH